MKRILITLITLLWGANISILAQTHFVVLNDTTVYCQKDNTGFITQFNNGKIVNKNYASNLLNIKESNDTLFWNQLRNKIKPINPKIQLFVYYPNKNNPNKSFIWFVKNKKGIHWISSHKSVRGNETNFFSVDVLVKKLSGIDNIEYENKIYKNIITNLSGYTGNKNWKSIRGSLRKKLNEENYTYKLVGFKNQNGKTDYIFISKLLESGILPLYQFNTKLKEIKNQTNTVKTIDESNKLVISSKDMLFFLGGILFTLILITGLYFLFRKKLLPVLISKNANQIVKTGLPELVENIEPKLLESFNKISEKFTGKFNIYKDVTQKLNLVTEMDTNKAFMQFLNKELEKHLKDSNNVKTLIEFSKYKSVNQELQKYEDIFSRIQASDIINNELKQKIVNNKGSIIDIVEDLIKKIQHCSGKEQDLKKELDDKINVISNITNEKRRIEQEKLKINNELEIFKNFRDKLQEIFDTIRALEIEILRFNIVKKNSNDSKNNVFFYLMQLQTLLNILYCSVSNCDNMDNHINNLQQMKVLDNEDVKNLIKKLKGINLDNLAFRVRAGEKPLSHEAYQRVFDLFNGDVDDFPSPFYYGVGKDMVAK